MAEVQPNPVPQPTPNAMFSQGRPNPPAQQGDKTAADKAAADRDAQAKAADGGQRQDGGDKDDRPIGDQTLADLGKSDNGDVQRARDEAAEKRKAADEAKAKVHDAKKSDEQREADRLAQEADDADARVAQAASDKRAGDTKESMTVGEAGVIAPGIHPRAPAGHHRAQKFDNDPANPKPARAEHSDPKLMTVKLTRWSNDRGGHVHTMVHPEMVGDYLRAGWSQSDLVGTAV